MSAEADQKYRDLAYDRARKWAQKGLSGDLEGRAISAVILELLDERPALIERAENAEHLAFSLGCDMLHALEAWVSQEIRDPIPAEYEPLHYIARGWRRDHDDIKISDCAEGRLVDETLENSDLGVETS